MKQKDEIIALFSRIKKFSNEEENDVVIPEMMDYFFDITESEDDSDFVLLFYCLDDSTKRFDMTQFVCEGILSFYYNRKSPYFFKILLENIYLIYPNAIQKTKNILMVILNDNQEARNLLCESLESADKESLSIFKEIYLLMIEEDNTYSDECIVSKLNMTSS